MRAEQGLGTGAVTTVLAPREVEVLRYIAQGFTDVQAAHRMGVTIHTLDTYLRRIRAKRGVRTRAALIQLAIGLSAADS